MQISYKNKLYNVTQIKPQSYNEISKISKYIIKLKKDISKNEFFLFVERNNEIYPFIKVNGGSKQITLKKQDGKTTSPVFKATFKYFIITQYYDGLSTFINNNIEYNPINIPFKNIIWDFKQGDLCCITFKEINDDLYIKLQKNKPYRCKIIEKDLLIIPISIPYSKKDIPIGQYIECDNLPYKNFINDENISLKHLSPEEYFGLNINSIVQYKNKIEYEICTIISITNDGVLIEYNNYKILLPLYTEVYQLLRVIDTSPIIESNIDLIEYSSTSLDIFGKNFTENSFLSFKIKQKNRHFIDKDNINTYINITSTDFISSTKITIHYSIKESISQLGPGCELLCFCIDNFKTSTNFVPICTIGLPMDKFDGLILNKLPYWKSMMEFKPLLTFPNGKSWMFKFGKYGYHNPYSNYTKEKKAYLEYKQSSENAISLKSEENQLDINENEDDISDNDNYSFSQTNLIPVIHQSHYFLHINSDISKIFTLCIKEEHLTEILPIQKLIFHCPRDNLKPLEISSDIKVQKKHDYLEISCDFPLKDFMENKNYWIQSKPWTFSLQGTKIQLLNTCMPIKACYTDFVTKISSNINCTNFKCYKIYVNDTITCDISIPTLNTQYFTINSKLEVKGLINKIITICTPSYQRAETATLDFNDIMPLVTYLHFIFVRSNEFNIYQQYWGDTHIIVSLPDSLPSENKLNIKYATDGIGYCRQIIYNTMRLLGLTRFWMIDDNISQFKHISRDNPSNTIKCSLKEIICEIEKIFTPLLKTSIIKRSNDYEPYNNSKIIQKNKNKCFDVYQDGPSSHLNPKLIEENILNIDINYNNPTSHFNIGEFSGPSDRYAIIGLRQWSKYSTSSSKKNYDRAHCYCVNMINIEAIEKVNKEYGIDKQISFPNFPIAEDCKFNDRCDYYGLWVCRCNIYQFVKPQTRIKRDNWKNEYLLYFRLRYHNLEAEPPYIHISNGVIIEGTIENALIIPLRIYANCYSLYETLSSHVVLQKYLFKSKSIRLFINSINIPISGKDSSKPIKSILDNMSNIDNIYDLVLECDYPLINPIIPCSYVRFGEIKEKYNQYDVIKIIITSNNKATCEIILTDSNGNKYCKYLQGYENNNQVIFKITLGLAGKIQFTATANQIEKYTKDKKEVIVSPIVDNPDNIFANNKLTFSAISFPNKAREYLLNHKDLEKEFTQIINDYKNIHKNNPPIPSLFEIQHTEKSVRLVQFLAYISVLNYFSRIERKHPIICLPTGMGKSLTSLLVPFQIASRRVIIIAPTLAILSGYQEYFPSTSSEKQSLLITCGVLSKEVFNKLRVVFWLPNCSNKSPDNYINKNDKDYKGKLIQAHIIVITFQSLSILSDEICKICDIDMLIIDECHHSKATSFSKIRNSFPNSKIIGFTATPKENIIKDEPMEVIFKAPVNFGIKIGEIKQLQANILNPLELEISDSNNDTSNTSMQCYNCSKERKEDSIFCDWCSPALYLRNHMDNLSVKVPSKIKSIVLYGGNEDIVDKFFYSTIINKNYVLNQDRIISNAYSPSFRNMLIEVEKTRASKSIQNIISESILELDNQYQNNMNTIPQAIVMCKTIQQMNRVVLLYKKIIQNLYIERKISCLYIVGSANIKENIIKLRNNTLHIIIQCKKLSEGFDYKPLSIAVILKPIRSLSVFYQFIGRIMRIVPNNSELKGIVFLHSGIQTHLLWDKFIQMDNSDDAFISLESNNNKSLVKYSGIVTKEEYTKQTKLFE